MKTSLPLVLTLVIIFFINFDVMANTTLNKLVKEQQRNDSSVFRENKILKKDVYSSVTNVELGDITLSEEKNCYLIKKLKLENEFFSSHILKDIKSVVEGRCLGTKGIQSIATQLQDYFIKTGFITTRVETPSQNLSEQQLLLRIVPGRIENIIIINDDFYDWILPFRKGDVLNIRHIEQALENIQKSPGTDVKINIVPGELEGYSNVIINSNRSAFWNLHTNWNNWGDESTGRQLVSAAAYAYNMSRINDIFWLAGSTSTTRNYKNISTYYSFPFAYWEFELFYSQSKSQQPITISDFKIDYSGESKYFSLKSSRTLYRDQEKKVTGSAELLKRKSIYKIDDIELDLQARDMVNIRLAINYKENIPDGVFDTTLRWQRFLGILGSDKTPDMISGDVDTKSQIYNLSVHYLKWIFVKPIPMYYDLNIGTQYSSHSLTLQDQFSIGNRWTIRGFESSSGLDGDKGFYLQNTLGFITGYRNVELYLGVDYGQVSVDRNAQALYSDNKMLGGVIGFKGLINSLAYDVSLTAPIIYPHNFIVDKFNMNFNFSFQL